MDIFTMKCRCGEEVPVPFKEIGFFKQSRDSKKRFYSFRCPLCRAVNTFEADPLTIGMFLRAGVKPKLLSLPAEIFEQKPRGPMTTNDALDLMLLLRDTNDFWETLFAESTLYNLWGTGLREPQKEVPT